MRKIILASHSARRHRILSECGIEHMVMASEVEEFFDPFVPTSRIVLQNAEAKVLKISEKVDSGIIIGADTLVSCNGETIGKPSDKKEAREILRKLSGTKAEVCTGLCVYDTASGKTITDLTRSAIRTDKIGEEDLENYLNILAPYDKAGGFSIEGVGSLLFDNIKGSYFNILGLPMMSLKRVFKDIGLNILDQISLSESE